MSFDEPNRSAISRWRTRPAGRLKPAWAGAVCVGLTSALVGGCSSLGGSAASADRTGPICADVSFPIYFATGSDQLSEPAHQAISAGAAEAHGCRVSEVDVFGLTEVDGTPDRNLELSRRRADAVAQALAIAGMPRPLFDVKGLGESNAVTTRGRPVMLQRKTQVVIHVSGRT